MGLLWYDLHDRSMRLTIREKFRLHWRANLAMLRSPRAIVTFTAISLLPSGLWLGVMQLLFELTNTNKGWPSPVSLRLFLISIPVYLLAQHLAFLRAMQWWYVPFVRRAFGTMGRPVCLGCGHPEAPGAIERCPECGRQSSALRLSSSSETTG